MNLIVVADKNWAIGCGNKLLYSIPEDMKFFKETTLGKVVVMGGKTYQSLPSGALKGRTNIVLSRNKDIYCENVIVCDTLENLIIELEKYSDDNIFIIGGEMFYRTMLIYCNKAYVTKIDAETKEADSFFPNLEDEEYDYWKAPKCLNECISNGHKVTFNLYTPRYMNKEMTKKLRQLRLKHKGFGPELISSDIFGNMSEDLISRQKVKELGAHYTSEKNISKLINPLFMDKLNEEFEKFKSNPKELKLFHEKISNLKFLDPACGCGNFLMVAYKKLRLLELEILKVLKEKNYISKNKKISLKVSLKQFNGIEIDDELCNLAKAALFIIDQQINILMYEELGLFLPQIKSANIVNGNALLADWEEIVPKDELNYIFGNPPFCGYSNQSKEQKADIKSVYIDENGEPFSDAGKIDYVAAWYYKSAHYMRGSNIKAAFVSTNSIIQGEQNAPIFKPLFNKFGISINFAYTPFKWSNEAKNKAKVYCVIIGFSTMIEKERIIFDKEKRNVVKNINSYFLDAPNVFVERSRKTICDAPSMFYGSKPVDNGNFMIEANEYENFIKNEPYATKYIKKICGAKEFVNGIDRFCLWLVDAESSELNEMPLISERIEKVREFRLESPKKATRKSAENPALFQEIRQPSSSYIIVPLTTSGLRRYIPIGFLDKDIIVSNLASIIPDGTLYHFGILSSSTHMAWVRIVCGRLRDDYRYSGSIIYNNFPWPDVTKEQYNEIEDLAQNILNARIKYSPKTLADMYGQNFELSYPDLMNAHEKLDYRVMQLYNIKNDATEANISATLFKQYSTLLEKQI